MNVQQHLRQAIQQQLIRLRADVPPDRLAALLAVLRTRDRLALQPNAEPLPDLITGSRLTDPGGNMALRLCLETTDDPPAAPATSEEDIDRWAERFLRECGELAEAELVLTHAETGFLRIVDDANGAFAAWIATKRTPASWQERADIAWWASWLAGRSETPSAAPHERSRDDVHYRRLADGHLQRMASQLGYPADLVLGGCTIQTYRDVLGRLIAWALETRDRGDVAEPRSEHDLIATLAAPLAIDPDVVARAVSAFTLDRENTAWHAAVPGVAAAPLVRVAPDRLVWSLSGLTTEPLFFLTRELRRRDAEAYHNAAHHREIVFRQDLYALFADKRFVTSAGRIALRRQGGNVRTDIDAVIFDRKTGTLGLFELKSQDPFARSSAELTRQRDNILYANRQISAVLAWLNQHGADALLSRVDARTARTFRAHKVYPFVLGRYLAHFGDGPEPDRRAAWGTWPQLLRLLDGQAVRGADANPIASLFTRLAHDVPRLRPSGDVVSREISLDAARLVVHPSYAAFRGGAATRDSSEPGSTPLPTDARRDPGSTRSSRPRPGPDRDR